MATLSFADQIKRASQQVLEEVNKKCLSISFQLFQTIIMETTVDEGKLINNWFPQAGNTFSSETTEALSTYGSDSLSRVNSLVYQSTEFLGKDGSMTMANNLPYAYGIEYATPEGRKYQKPEGFVRVSLVKIAAQYR